MSTTAVLAGSVPLEPKVPEAVKESQEKAHVGPGASGIAEEVKEKAEVESELLDKVKEAPTTSEGTAGKGTEKTEDVVTPGEAAASVAAAATAVGAAAVVGAVAAKDIAVEKATVAQTSAIEAAANLPDSAKEQLPESVQNAIGTTKKEETREEVSPEVPAEVKESIIEAGKDPEAAANTEAVEDKKAVEAELLKEVKAVDAEAAGNSSEIRIPPASESAIANGANGANGHQETVKPVEIKRVPTNTEPTAPATLAVPETTAQPTEVTSPTSSAKPANGAATEKKKKSRLSSIFGKVKSKLSGK